MSKKVKSVELPKVDAREMLRTEAAEAANACEREIQASLAKYKCNIEPTFMATARGNMFHLNIKYGGFQEQ